MLFFSEYSISGELYNFGEPLCQNPKSMVMVLLLVMKFEECIQSVWHINTLKLDNIEGKTIKVRKYVKIFHHVMVIFY